MKQLIILSIWVWIDNFFFIFALLTSDNGLHLTICLMWMLLIGNTRSSVPGGCTLKCVM